MYNKSSMLDELGRHEQGLRAYDKVLKLRPNLAQGGNNKSLALVSLNRYFTPPLQGGLIA